MQPLVEIEVVLDRLGVAPATPEADDVGRLLDAVSAEIRRLTRRGFEGDEGATYTETYRVDGDRELVLRHGPVASIISIAKEHFDGTVDPAWDAAHYRLEDPERGRVRLYYRAGYVRVVYRVTGDTPAPIPQAASDWIAARWQEREREGLASYQTGDDAESYFASLVGKVPGPVARTLALYFHATGGGPV